MAGDLAGCEQAIAETAACGIAAGSTNAPLLATVLGLVLSLVRGDFVQVIERIDSLVDDAPARPHQAQAACRIRRGQLRHPDG